MSARKAPREGPVVATIATGPNKEVRVTIVGSRFHLREWFRAGDGEMRPGRQGIALRANQIAELAAALARGARP